MPDKRREEAERCWGMRNAEKKKEKDKKKKSWKGERRSRRVVRMAERKEKEM
jgi:hypothetical protein